MNQGDLQLCNLHDIIRKSYADGRVYMNTNQLRYFVAAAESKSFTKAADQYYISQTAITQQIRVLEEILGVMCIFTTLLR